MVRGLDKLKEYFNGYTDNYIIIGGTACDLILSGEGFKPRATKDIDIILVIEALTPEFVKQFWKLVVDGKYGGTRKALTKGNTIAFQIRKKMNFRCR